MFRMMEWRAATEKAVGLVVGLGLETPETLRAFQYLDLPNTLTYLGNLLLMLDGARRLAVKHCTKEIAEQISEAQRASIAAFQACLAANGSKPIDPGLVCEIGDRTA